MKCIAVFISGPTSQSVDLSTLFGNVDTSHYYTLIADGVKSYVAFAPNAASIDESALGSATLACIPIADGTQLPFRPVGGPEVASGSATGCNYHFLIYKAPTGTATGYLRLYRSSLSPNQGTNEFKGPLTGF